jgi:hypothetical protein
VVKVHLWEEEVHKYSFDCLLLSSHEPIKQQLINIVLLGQIDPQTSTPMLEKALISSSISVSLSKLVY